MKKVFLNMIVSTAFITLSVLSFAQLKPYTGEWTPDYKNHVTGANAVERAKEVNDYLKQEYDTAVKKYMDAMSVYMQSVWKGNQTSNIEMNKALDDKKAIEDEMNNGLGKYAAAVLFTDKETAEDQMNAALKACYAAGEECDAASKDFDVAKKAANEAYDKWTAAGNKTNTVATLILHPERYNSAYSRVSYLLYNALEVKHRYETAGDNLSGAAGRYSEAASHYFATLLNPDFFNIAVTNFNKELQKRISGTK